ncbi:MAG TPA: DUF1552 domain-containing protein [Polyangiaceae bacterium]|nr:DUF1552 domain-containing protein [Polyangiaceae bacterium]
MSPPPRRGIEIGRRVFLRGAAGAVVALPILEGLLPKGVKAQDATHPYAIFMRQGNGCQQGLDSEPDRFWPTNLGPLTTAGMQADGDQAVNVLADFAAKLLIVRGCEMKSLQDAGCGHSSGGLLCLTASKADGKNVEKALATGESIDNRIERELSGAGKEPLTLRASVRSSYLDDVLSYRSAGNRRVAESNPYNAYKALFGLSTSMSSSDTDKLAKKRKSVNDLVRNELNALLANPKLSKDDRDRIQQHQQAIRDLEVGMQCQLPPELLTPLSGTTTSQAESDSYAVQTVKMHSQVIALAVACGKVHAVTLQIGNGNDQTQYTINGTKYQRYHYISHRIESDGSQGTPIANADVMHHDIDKLFAGMFKGLLTELDSRTTPTGTLLDEGVAIWLNDLSNGPPHSTTNMPYICAGSCGGKLKQGVYVDAGNKASNKYVTHNKFLNTIGAVVGCKNSAGAPLDDFGDSTLEKGQIAQMLA